MSYSIYVSDNDGPDCCYYVNEHLGASWFVSLYWTNMGKNLPIISSVLGCASSEEGFILPPERVDDFEKELSELEEIWCVDELTSTNQELMESLKERKKGFDKAIVFARKYYRPIEVW